MSRPPDSPLEPPPRKAYLRRGIKNVRRAYRTVFALVILVFGGWAAIDGFRWYDLAFQINTADGKILKKQIIPRPTGQEYRLEYAFTTADGTPILHGASVPPPIFEKVMEDGAVLIIYLADNPKNDHWLFNNNDERAKWMYLTLGHGLAALLAVIILRVVDRPLQRELRLARYGIVIQGRILTVGKPRGRRAIVKITYSFRTAAGATVQGACNLPRRFPVHTVEPGMAIDIVVDPANPRIQKPRLALDFVEFGEAGRKKTP